MICAKKIFVCCPQIVTGGPELLHQLVHALRGFGHEAYICYFPFGQPFECPEPYRVYDAPQSRLIDEPENFVLIPESSTWLVRHVRKAAVGVWWLSVDNYFGLRRKSVLRDIVSWVLTTTFERVSLRRLHCYGHFVQSEYAREFLLAHEIQAEMLTDYLNNQYFSVRQSPRENIIAFNPRKGGAIVERLRKKNLDFKFVPIVGMTPSQVVDLLSRAKVYIDFGHHPGKDRPPREAAICGACVIVGDRGSAGNAIDIPIQDIYKLSQSSPGFYKEFRLLVESIFDDFASHQIRFEAYRKKISAEKESFLGQVLRNFGCVER
ncbi:MAG: hypothetical protein QM709_00015 [Spongiibacteraceae bacterium]